MKHFIFFTLLMIALSNATSAQMNVGSSNAPDSSAMLQVSGNIKRFFASKHE